MLTGKGGSFFLSLLICTFYGFLSWSLHCVTFPLSFCFFLCACMAAWHRYGFYLFAGGFFFSFSDQWADPIDYQTTDPRREVCILGKCIKSSMVG